MNSPKFGLLLGMLWMCIPSAAIAQERVPLDLDTKNKIVYDLGYVADSAGILTVDQVTAPDFQQNFIQNTASTMVKSTTPVYWVKFALTNTLSEVETWIIEYPGWEEVDLYMQTPDKGTVRKQTGHYKPMALRDYAVANRNYLKIKLDPEESVTCYARLECTRTNVEPFPINLAFKVSAQHYQIREDSIIKSAITAFVGILLVMFLYNFIIFISTKDKNYLWYLGTVVCVAYLTANNSGYLHEVFANWNGFIDFRVPVVLGVVVLLVFFSLNFTRSFLQVRKRYSTWSKIFNIIIGLAVLAYILTFVQFEMGWNLSNLVNLLAVLAAVIVTVRSVIIRYPGSGIFLAAYGFNMVGSMILLFALVGTLPYTIFTGNLALPLGSTLEAVLFSIALADRINALKQDKEKSQQEALDMALENERIVRNQKEMLEVKVTERTAEINKQKEQILEQKDIIEKQMMKSDELLLNILPESTAEELKRKGSATPRYYKSVTIMFVDVKGFTKIAEQLSAEHLVSELDYCFQHFDDIIVKYNLEKIKTIGDSYMCAGGIPETNKTHARDCVNASFEILEFLDQWRKEKLEQGENPWEFRIGMHTGPVTAGVVGKNKFAYDIWGDSVNMAARMESTGTVGKINISENTYNLIKDSYVCENRGKIAVKGKGEIEMYYVLGRKPTTVTEVTADTNT